MKMKRKYLPLLMAAAVALIASLFFSCETIAPSASEEPSSSAISGQGGESAVEQNSSEISDETQRDSRYPDPGTYKKEKGAYFTTIRVEDDGYAFMGPTPLEIGSVIFRYPMTIDNEGLLHIAQFTFRIVDENTLQYIRPDDPDDLQRHIADGSLYKAVPAD